MKINRNSWHFTIHRWFGKWFDYTPRPKNLCRYFWTTVIQVILLATVGAIIAILYFVLFKWVFMAAEWYDEKHPYVPKVKEPGLVRSFIKARKEKVCPLIEVVDDAE